MTEGPAERLIPQRRLACGAELRGTGSLEEHEDATEESKPDSVSGDHLSARQLPAGPPITRSALYPGLREQRQRPCLRLQQGGLPFSLPPSSPRRFGRAFVSVALAIGCPTPVYTGHLALRCLDFPLTPPKRGKRPPFLRRMNKYIRVPARLLAGEHG